MNYFHLSGFCESEAVSGENSQGNPLQDSVRRAEVEETRAIAQRIEKDPILGGLQTATNKSAIRRLSVSQRLGLQSDHDGGSVERIPPSQRLGLQDSPDATTDERLSIVQRLGPLPADQPSSERIPVNLRLGHQEVLTTDEQGTSLAPPKRKPGRPPGCKANLPNATSTTKRRKTKGSKPSPVRRTSATDPPAGRPNPMAFGPRLVVSVYPGSAYILVFYESRS
ncbi:hypothetical protein Bca52824_004669 [Brassica carinata]|uniref:Uncharacterized protein n=1 Tax=Brassica carinata TaxID=52824 RepID=A0A8X8BCH7_BRACI|nr:hypothetical protein Bca52824_004669 [Brassica carinata]